MDKKNKRLSSILVVDDEEEILQILKTGLTNRGFIVFSAVNSRDAIAISSKEQIQYALLDIRLPGMNGIELSEKLKKSNPDVVIILMTGYPGITNVIRALRHHVYDYLIKPFRIEQVISVIERARRENRLIGENIYNAEIIRMLKQENEKLKTTIKEIMPDKYIRKVQDSTLDKFRTTQTDHELAIRSYTQQRVDDSFDNKD